MDRPGFYLTVAGDAGAPADLVFRALDHYTARVRVECQLVVLTRGGGHVADWARRRPPGEVAVVLEPVLRGLYGRYAEPRWAMACCAVSRGVLIFGDRGRFWRLVRYAAEAGVPVRVVPVPAPVSAPHAAG